jgi:hypothetical protein
MGMVLRMKDEVVDELLELPDLSRLSVNRIKAFSISNSLLIDWPSCSTRLLWRRCCRCNEMTWAKAGIRNERKNRSTVTISVKEPCLPVDPFL